MWQHTGELFITYLINRPQATKTGIIEGNNNRDYNNSRIGKPISEQDEWISSGILSNNVFYTPDTNSVLVPLGFVTGRVRVNRLLSLADEFYETYDIQPGDAMYVAPEDRVSVW